jgi:hypothetical protein
MEVKGLDRSWITQRGGNLRSIAETDERVTLDRRAQRSGEILTMHFFLRSVHGSAHDDEHTDRDADGGERCRYQQDCKGGHRG